MVYDMDESGRLSGQGALSDEYEHAGDHKEGDHTRFESKRRFTHVFEQIARCKCDRSFLAMARVTSLATVL